MESEAIAAQRRRIARNRVRPGMTAAQVQRLWGSPYKVNRTRTVAGTSDQWIYGEFCKPCVYLENGTVTAIQD